MKLRRINTQTDSGRAVFRVEALGAQGWVSLAQLNRLEEISLTHGVPLDLASNLISVLKLSEQGLQDLQSEVDQADVHADQHGQVTLPFQPRSFREFMLFDKHIIDASRGFVRRFMPGKARLTNAYEKIFQTTFPAFKPDPLWYTQPIYYLGNHNNFLAPGEDVIWPSYTQALDYELELGAVLRHSIQDANEQQALDAIGGFVVVNDLSARDVQLNEMKSGFGPQKAKHFLSAMSDTLVTADEVLPRINSLCGQVEINGKVIANPKFENPQFDFAAVIMHASKGEKLHAGELICSGTLPGGSGMESGHWLKRGDEIRLSIEGVGASCNRIRDASELTAQPDSAPAPSRYSEPETQ